MSNEETKYVDPIKRERYGGKGESRYWCADEGRYEKGRIRSSKIKRIERPSKTEHGRVLRYQYQYQCQ